MKLKDIKFSKLNRHNISINLKVDRCVHISLDHSSLDHHSLIRMIDLAPGCKQLLRILTHLGALAIVRSPSVGKTEAGKIKGLERTKS